MANLPEVFEDIISENFEMFAHICGDFPLDGNRLTLNDPFTWAFFLGSNNICKIQTSGTTLPKHAHDDFKILGFPENRPRVSQDSREKPLWIP